MPAVCRNSHYPRTPDGACIHYRAGAVCWNCVYHAKERMASAFQAMKDGTGTGDQYAAARREYEAANAPL